MRATETLVIERRYNGPPASGQGGYVSGRIAALLEHDVVEVTLRSPPPLDHPLKVIRHGDDALRIEDDGTTVAEARAATLDLAIPEAVTFEQASEASSAYPGFQEHIYPTCFVCGPERDPGDGLRVFVGKVEGRRVGAGAWIPDLALSRDGVVESPLMWGALDCPSFWGVVVVDNVTDRVLLGRMTARVTRLARAGERCVTMGWPLERDGRKIHAASAVFGEKGELLGAARSTWIALA